MYSYQPISAMSSSSDDGVDGVEPIEIVEKSISVTNGEQLRPSTFNVYSKASTHYLGFG